MLALAQSAARADDLPTASADEIVAGARSCAIATSAAGVDAGKLTADGWSAASLSADGKPAGGSLRFFGRGPLIAMFDAGHRPAMCIVTARVASVGDLAPLRASLASAYGAPVKDDGKGEEMFFTPDRHIVDLASTGSSERPAVRVAVGILPQEK